MTASKRKTPLHSTLNGLIDKLDINEQFTKPIKKPKVFTHINDSVTPLEDYNFMADLLQLPKTDEGYKYLLVMVDVVTHAFDIEPMKNKEAITTLDAMKRIFKRKYLKKPYASLRTDNGNEFMGPFDKFLHDNNIFHSLSLPYRHTQLSAVESLNKQLGRLFNGFMNSVEEKTGEEFREWTNILDIVRKELNSIRYVKPKYTPDNIAQKYELPHTKAALWTQPPKFKVGDLVHRQLEIPYNALGHPQPTHNFRVGDYRYDIVPSKIIKVLYFNGKIPYRYMLSGIKTTSFTESQLMGSMDKVQRYKVKRIIDKKKIKGKVYYLIWWKSYKKNESTWESKSDLIHDIPLLIKNYESSLV